MKLQKTGALDDISLGAVPMAPMGAEPPEFFSDAQNAGLALAPMAPGGTVAGGSPPVAPMMRVAIALEQARRTQQR